MYVAARVVGTALLLTAAWTAPLVAQEAAIDARGTIEATGDEADRAALRELFARPEVRQAARVGGIDLGQAEERLATLEGDQLHRAATQARALDSRLGERGAADVISIEVTTLIIILLIVIIIILLA